MQAPAAERKALLFSAGGAPLALRLSQVREVVTAPTDAPAEVFRGATPIEVASALRLAPGRGALAVLTDAPLLALYVDAVEGIIDLGGAEVFQLPVRTRLPAPPPFGGALVHRGKVWLEVAPAALAAGAPFTAATEAVGPPPEAPFALGPELLFRRAGRTWAVPLALLTRVLEGPVVQPVPLTSPAHRGLLYHGRSLHPVFDLADLYGDAPSKPAGAVLLVDAGGEVVAVLSERIVPPGDPAAKDVVRPAWDALFAPTSVSLGNAGKS